MSCLWEPPEPPANPESESCEHYIHRLEQQNAEMLAMLETSRAIIRSEGLRLESSVLMNYGEELAQKIELIRKVEGGE